MMSPSTTDHLRERGLVFYDPPAWESRQFATQATLEVLRQAPEYTRARDVFQPVAAEQQWLDAATGLLRQLVAIPDSEPYPSALTYAIDGVNIGLANVGGARVGSTLAIAQSAFRFHRGPDAVWLLPEICHDIVIPFRVLDAAQALYMPVVVPRVREDILAAFEAIWIAREFAAAYSYVRTVVTSGEWTP